MNSKKTSIVIIILLIGIISVFAFGGETNKEYLRIHIRANSNEFIDQNIKYKIKDEVIRFLTPVVAESKSKESAIKNIELNLFKIEKTVDNLLKQNGYTYTAKANIKSEEFPTRAYGDFVLENGVYDALIIELGEAKGDNWWCVVYPPLCFTGGEITGEGIKYKSKILEIIEEFKQKK